MCGIVGFVGEKNVAELLPACLKKLDYRGYDSFGFAFQNNSLLLVVKQVGRITDFNGFLAKSASIGIAHSRWATHGAVTKKNAHPHISCDGKIAIVHNGIIENHSELREKLAKKGHSFAGETDSEVAVHLAEEFINQGRSFREAARETCRSLKGAFALLFINRESNELIAARNGSPLILGLVENGTFVASDTTAFIEFTKQAIFLDDGQIAFLGKEIELENFNTGQKLSTKISHIEWDAEQAQKNGFEHFMLKEIFEQPDAIEKCIQGRIANGQAVLPELDSIAEKLGKINRIVIVACGTSWHAGLVAEYAFEELCALPVEVEYSAEFRYRNPVIDENCLVIAISQSGETADTLAALREAKKHNAPVLSICNVMGSTIARESDAVIYTRAGPEIGVASTKAFTTQLAVLNLVALFIALQRNSAPESKVTDALNGLKSIPNAMRKTLEQSKTVEAIAGLYWDKSNALYLGRGPNYPIALEGALKLKEISYLHAEGMPAAEMKHGPIALIDSNMPVVFIAVKDRTYEKVLANIEEVRARNGCVIAVSSEAATEIKNLSDSVIYIAETIPLFQPMLSVIPLQLLAYHIAKKRNCDIDKPRNLAKSVTVE